MKTEEILEEFRSFYETLYNLQSEENINGVEINRRKIKEYLAKIHPSKVEALKGPVVKEEVLEAINSIHPGKVPGPDGFPSSYYKCFKDTSIDPYIEAFNGLGMGLIPSPELLRANIVVIPKEGKDPPQCGSYLPISLLNEDIKIYTKVMAARLLGVVYPLIHQDQVGFLPTREARDNCVRLLDLIHLAEERGKPSLLLSTDAEKAFDRVDWGFLEELLAYIGLSERMCANILALYRNPSASVAINGAHSSVFHLNNGTRQGCPMSPLIFILSLEPLLCRVRKNGDIEGLECYGSRHKVAAYADDLMLTIANPRMSLPRLYQELRLGKFLILKLIYQNQKL